MKITGNSVSVFRFAFHSRPPEGRAERRHEDDPDRLGRRSCWVDRKAMCDLFVTVEQSVPDRSGGTRSRQYRSLAPLARAVHLSGATG